VESRPVACFLVAIAVLQGLDVATTWLVLGQGGAEANPLSAAVMGLGFGGWVLLKLLLVGGVLVGARLVRRASARERTAVAAVAGVVAAGLSAAVASNLWLLATHAA
jgi:hypothetical protein